MNTTRTEGSLMDRPFLKNTEIELSREYAKRQQLGAYNADAETITFLTHCCLFMIRQLIKADEEIAKIKRTAKLKK